MFMKWFAGSVVAKKLTDKAVKIIVVEKHYYHYHCKNLYFPIIII